MTRLILHDTLHLRGMDVIHNFMHRLWITLYHRFREV